MFIGEIQETGLIEPVVFPRVVPERQPVPEIEVPALEPAQSG